MPGAMGLPAPLIWVCVTVRVGVRVRARDGFRARVRVRRGLKKRGLWLLEARGRVRGWRGPFLPVGGQGLYKPLTRPTESRLGLSPT